MASIYKRGVAWRAQVMMRGVRLNGTFDTQREARTWADRVEADILAGRRTSNAPKTAVESVTDLLDRYARDISPTKRGARWESVRLKKLARDPAFQRPIAELDGKVLADWRDERHKKVSAGSVNRELGLLSAVFTRAVKEWRVPHLSSNPVQSIMRLPNPRPRTQRVSDADRAAIVAALGWDGAGQPTTAGQWTAFSFSLALETAARRGELHSIRWGDVDVPGRCITLRVTKNGTERKLPLSKAALALLALLQPGEPTAPLLRVSYDTAGTLYRRGAAAAGRPHVRYHDARRECISRFSKKVASVLELSAISGHKSLNMLRVYYAPENEYLADLLE